MVSSAYQFRIDAADPVIAALRTREFSRLDRDHLAYLDYTGSALYAESLVAAHHALLARGVLGNPHSENEPSRASGALIDDARADVLQFFDADPDEYVVCFTANASAAVKLVAESYPFTPQSLLALSEDNHNSVNGMREYAKRGGTRIEYLPLDASLRLDEPEQRLASFRASAGAETALFAFPAQSNFSGIKHPLHLVDRAHAMGYDVLLDAAAFAPSNPLSLRQCPAEFVALSFYKLFGYPTGVGALIARRDALTRLHRPWFAGGTVMFVSVQHDVHRLRALAEGFEDGTPDFLNIVAVPAGLAVLRGVGMQRIQDHVGRLTGRFLDGLAGTRHASGAPVVEIYGAPDMRDRGGIVAFNVLESNGRVVPYIDVERRARDAGIAVRGGCFCNPGAAEHAFGFEPQRSGDCLSAVANGFTLERFAACMDGNVPVGAVRVSLGIANNTEDVDRGLALIETFAG
jgi:selenocysteine lyase/cysteine desulfurase